MEKRVLILEDLGVKQEKFKRMFKTAKLPFNLVWAEKDKNVAAVSGLITVKKPLGAAELAKFPNLEFIAVAFTGYDSVNLNYCRRKRIAVYNVPAYAIDSVAELTIALAISLLRRIPAADRSVRAGGWAFAPGLELKGKTVGIIGTGEIGINVAKLFKAFGCRIIGWSRTEKKEFKKLGGVYVEDLKKMLAQADLVSLHLPFNKLTDGLLGEKEFKDMKKTAFIINTARGGVIKQAELVKALKNKTIAGAALDVFEREPLSEKHILRRLPNVILTPHIAFKTSEALVRRAQTTIENIKNFLNKKKDNRVV